MVTSVCQFIQLLLVHLEAKETVVVTENTSFSEENCSVVDMLSHQGVQHVPVEESRAVSGDWVHDVMRTGEDSWRPLFVVMMCSVSCVTSTLIQASRLEQKLGTHSAFGMTSRWLLMTSGRENLLSHLNVTNITMDNVAMFDTQQMRQSSHRRQRRRSSHFIQTLMWTHGSRYWTPVDAVASHTKYSSADHQDTFVSALKEGTGDLEDSLFPNIRHGYNGRRLRVLIKEWMSFVLVCDESGQRVWCGLLLDLLQVASTTFNFTYVAVNASGDEWGTGESDAANVGFYGRIFRQEADIGLTPTDIALDRTAVLDFSDPILFSSVVMVYRKPKLTPQRWVLFNPLSAQTIAAILGSLVLVNLLVCGLEMIVERLRRESVGLEERNPRERRWHSYRDWILTLDRALQVSGAAILSEASELQLRSRPARVLLCSWWMLSVVMAAAYSGTLTAFLSVTKQTQLFSSLEDLVTKQHDYTWGTVVVTSIFLFLQNSHNKVHQDILHGMQQFAMEDPDVLSEDLQVLTQKVGTEDFVLIFDGFFMENLFDCDFEVVPVDIKTVLQGLVFPKGSALTKPFSQVIGQLHSSGLLSHWTKKWFPRRSNCSPPLSGPMVISLLHVQGVLLLLPLGLGLALGVMAAERIYVHRTKRKMIEETVDGRSDGCRGGFRGQITQRKQ